MPLFLASLLGGLIQIAATLAGRVVVALGFSAVVFTGVSGTLDFIKSSVQASLGSLGGNTLQVVSALQVDTAVSILASAVAARLLLRGLTNGSLARWVVKP